MTPRDKSSMPQPKTTPKSYYTTEISRGFKVTQAFYDSIEKECLRKDVGILLNRK